MAACLFGQGHIAERASGRTARVSKRMDRGENKFPNWRIESIPWLDLICESNPPGEFIFPSRASRYQWREACSTTIQHPRNITSAVLA